MLEVSDTTVSRITDKILPVVREWQQRPLEAIYAVVFMDAIHYSLRRLIILLYKNRLVRHWFHLAIELINCKLTLYLLSLLHDYEYYSFCEPKAIGFQLLAARLHLLWQRIA